MYAAVYMLEVSATVRDDLAVPPRLDGFAFAAGCFLAGQSSPWELWPQMKTANETTQRETTTMQSPKSHDDDPRAADAAAPAPALGARILPMESSLEDGKNRARYADRDCDGKLVAMQNSASVIDRPHI